MLLKVQFNSFASFQLLLLNQKEKIVALLFSLSVPLINPTPSLLVVEQNVNKFFGGYLLAVLFNKLINIIVIHFQAHDLG